jgi:hypothetical protein
VMMAQLERQLGPGDWLVGGAFSWADIAIFDWLEKWPASRAARRTWARGRRSWSIRGLQGSRCTYGGPAGRVHVSITAGAGAGVGVGRAHSRGSRARSSRERQARITQRGGGGGGARSEASLEADVQLGTWQLELRAAVCCAFCVARCWLVLGCQLI